MYLQRFTRCLISVVLFCLFYSYAQGQSALIQQEQRRLPFIKDSIALVKSLNHIGMLYHQKDPDSCFYYGMKAKAIAIKLHYPKGEAGADNVIASALYLKGLPRESLQLFSHVLSAYRQLSDTTNAAMAMMNMATVYLNITDTIQAKKLSRQAIQMGTTLKKDSVMSLLYANYCIVNAALSDDSSRYYIGKSMEIANRYKDKTMLIVIRQLQANKLIIKGRGQEALPLIKQTLSESQAAGMEILEMNSLSLYADYYAAKPDSVLSYYNRIYALLQQKGYVYLDVKVLKVILAYTELSGDKDKIISVHRLMESALTAENDDLKKFTGDYIKYNALQEDNLLLETTNKSDKAKIGLLISVCVISILLIVFIYRLYKVSRGHAQRQAKLNQQIKAQNNTLQEADEFKNKLISILAHDFRTPLITTIGIARMMRDNQGFTKAEMEQFYGDIERDARQMLESFDTILQWIKQQLSGYQLKSEKLVLHNLFSETLDIFQKQLETKNIKLSNQVPERMTVIADKEMLQFLNRNLLSNAIRFSPEGGTIMISATQGADEFTITVADDGPGMSAETIKKLFSVSSQFVSPTQHGAGIALSMCRDFIQMLGGRIWAENKSPTGAVFYYTIPVKAAK